MINKQQLILNARTLAFIRVKIACFLVLYFLAGSLIISFFSDKIADFFQLLDLPKCRVFAGLIFVLTGISTSAIRSCRAMFQIQKMQKMGKVIADEQYVLYEYAFKMSNLVVGSLFIIEGFVFIISGVGEALEWWTKRQVFGLMLGRITMIAVLTIPFFVGSFVEGFIIKLKSLQ